MRYHAGLTIAIMVAAGTTACGSSFDPSTALDGTWVLTPPGVPGSGLHFTISDDGGTVSGSGERLIEAGPTLPFTVSGTQQGDAVSLTFAYPTGGPDTFSGRLTDATRLKGTLRTAEGAAAYAEFARAQPGTDPP
jgi:hypothetical protein